MKIKSRISRPARIEMLPLIDIVFLLLVFFIYAMLSMSVHGGRKVDLPSSELAAKTPNVPISITLEAHREGTRFRINDRYVLEENFIRILRKQRDTVKAGGNEPRVQLFADRTLPYQEVYHTLDRITGAGLSQVYLQARPVEQ